MLDRFSELKAKFPLGASWSEIELFEDRLELPGMSLPMVGLCATHRSGAQITGSAAGESPENCLDRSYFELLERTSIIEAESSDGVTFVLMDETGHSIGNVARSMVFPISPDPEKWVYSKSNGIAAHRTFRLAAQCAAKELVERDRILRSWFGGVPPQKSALPGFLEGLPAAFCYDVEAYSLPDENDEIAVSMVALFPRKREAPFVFGSGAGETEARATESAARECIQRLAFLWGEEIPADLPEISPSADFHQEYFLHTSGVARFRKWIDGENARRISIGAQNNRMKGAHRTQFSYVDLTPDRLREEIRVVKAISDSRLSLTFGGGAPWIGDAAIWPEAAIHPIA